MTTSHVSKAIDTFRTAVLARDGGGLTDGQLLGCFLENHDEAAFEALVRRHGPMVLGVCRRILLNNHDAEDAFQATFLVLVRKAEAVVPREMVGNFLYGVAYQTARKARALAARLRAREKQVAEMPEPAVVVSEPRDDWQPLLDQELSQLPDKYRVPLVLCDLEGQTRKEAAQQLGWPEGSVSGRLSRARELLARRLTRRGVALAGGALALRLSRNAASACVPARLVVSTVKAADLFAAGEATAGAIPVQVAALTEEVLRAMLIARLKMMTTVLVLVALVGLGTGFFTQPALAGKRGEAAAPAARAAQKDADKQASIAARVVAVSKEGKVITLETEPPNPRTGEDAKRTDIRLTDKTEITFEGVGLNGAQPAVGQDARVLLQQGSADTAARAHFTVADPALVGRAYGAKVLAATPDGKTITLELPPARGEQELRKIDVKLTDTTKLTYAYVAKEGAKPTAGYQAEVWLEGRGSDTATKVHFVDLAKEKDALVAGKLIGVGKDGTSLTVEVPSQVRGDSTTTKADVKITLDTAITFHGVGLDGARLAEGYGVRVWRKEGVPDTAARIMVYKPGERGR